MSALQEGADKTPPKNKNAILKIVQDGGKQYFQLGPSVFEELSAAAVVAASNSGERGRVEVFHRGTWICTGELACQHDGYSIVWVGAGVSGLGFTPAPNLPSLFKASEFAIGDCIKTQFDPGPFIKRALGPEQVPQAAD